MSSDVLEQFRSDWKRDLEKDTSKRKAAKQETSTTSSTPFAANGIKQATTTPPEAAQEASRESFELASDTNESVDSNDEQEKDLSRSLPQSPEHTVDSSSHLQNGQIKHSSALQIYELAVEKERQGLLSDALTNYRKAFKLDPTVDQQYRTAFRLGSVKEASYENAGTSVEDTNYAKFVQVGHDYDAKQSHETSKELQDMTAMMAALRMPIMTETKPSKRRTCGIDSLPEEILHQILTHAIVSTSASTFTALSGTCQKFFLLLHDYTIWKTLCYKTYRDQVYTGEGISLSSSSEYTDYLSKLDTEVQDHYGDSWKRMFIEKPRIRYDGIYISTCHYTRPGVREESLDWTSPIHLVTYFRFLRFFPDGSCLSLLTPAQPREVVHSVQRNTKLKGVQRGRWSITRAGHLSIESNGPANYLFFMELQIKSSSRGRHNKLVWTQFTGIHPTTAEVTQFNLKNDRSHYFHKVKSYVV